MTITPEQQLEEAAFPCKDFGGEKWLPLKDAKKILQRVTADFEGHISELEEELDGYKKDYGGGANPNGPFIHPLIHSDKVDNVKFISFEHDENDPGDSKPPGIFETNDGEKRVRE